MTGCVKKFKFWRRWIFIYFRYLIDNQFQWSNTRHFCGKQDWFLKNCCWNYGVDKQIHLKQVLCTMRSCAALHKQSQQTWRHRVGVFSAGLRKSDKKISSFHCRFSKVTNTREFRPSNRNISSVNEEFSSSEAYFFTFVILISLFHKWKSRFLAGVTVTRCKVLCNAQLSPNLTPRSIAFPSKLFAVCNSLLLKGLL